MAFGQLNRCIFTPTANGTGTWTVSAAIQGYLTPAQAGAVDGSVYSYAAEVRNASNAITDWEVGTGTYTASGTTLTRTAIFSSNSNAVVNFASAPVIMLTTIVDAAANKYLLVGNGLIAGAASSQSPPGFAAAIQTQGIDTASSSQGAFQYSNDGNGPYMAFAKSRGTTTGSNGQALGSDIVGGIRFDVNDGTSYYQGARILCDVQSVGTVSTGNVNCRMRFQTRGGGVGGGLGEAFRIDQDSNTIFAAAYNGADAQVIAGRTPNVQFISSTNDGAVSITEYTGASGGGSLILGKVHSGTVGTNTAIGNNEVMGNIYFAGADGTNIIFGASITAAADNNVTTGGMPGRIVFSTSQSGSSSPTQAAYVESGQRLICSPVFENINNARFQVHGILPEESRLAFSRWSNDGGPPSIQFYKAESGTIGTHSAAVGSSDGIGQLNFNGSDGTGFFLSGGINCLGDGGTTTGIVPGRITLSTADGTGTLQEGFRMDSNQLLTAGGMGSSFGGDKEILQINAYQNGASRGNGIGVYHWGTTNDWATINFYLSNNATLKTNGAPTSGMILGSLGFFGNDGGGFGISANIYAAADATMTGSSTPARLSFATCPVGTDNATTERMRIDSAGKIFGTDGSASNFGIMPAAFFIRQHATYTLATGTGAQKLFNGSTNGALTLQTGAYYFECMAYITSMSATSGNGAFSIANGTGTATNFLFTWTAVDATAPPASGGVAYQSGTATSGTTPTNMATAATATGMPFFVQGTFEVSVAGTIIPSIALTTSIGTAVVNIGSYFFCWRLGATTDVTQGNWS